MLVACVGEGLAAVRRLTAAVLAVCAMVLLTLIVSVEPTNATFPGGNGRIAYSTSPAHGHPSQIYTIRPDGSGLRQLTHVTVKGRGARSPAWNADGSEIAFAKRGHVWTMKADGSDKTRITDDTGFSDRNPAWSPDGSRIVYSHCDVSLGFTAYCDLDTVNVDGTGETKILGGHWTYDFPRFSPDGTKIAFAGDRGGLVCAVWVANADGSDPHRLTAPKLQANVPDWSPDGTQITFGSHCQLPGSKPWVMNADGSDQQRLISDAAQSDWLSSRFSPDGSVIAVAAYAGDIWFVNPDGTGLHEIAHHHDGILSLDWAARVASP